MFENVLYVQVTSDAPQQTVTDTELLSEFSHTPVTYDGTDTAIYLPEEFLRVGNEIKNTKIYISGFLQERLRRP